MLKVLREKSEKFFDKDCKRMWTKKGKLFLSKEKIENKKDFLLYDKLMECEELIRLKVSLRGFKSRSDFPFSDKRRQQNGIWLLSLPSPIEARRDWQGARIWNSKSSYEDKRSAGGSRNTLGSWLASSISWATRKPLTQPCNTRLVDLLGHPWNSISVVSSRQPKWWTISGAKRPNASLYVFSEKEEKSICGPPHVGSTRGGVARRQSRLARRACKLTVAMIIYDCLRHFYTLMKKSEWAEEACKQRDFPPRRKQLQSSKPSILGVAPLA